MPTRILAYCLLGPALFYVMVLALNPSQVLVSLRSLGDALPAAYLVLTGPFLFGALVDQIAKDKWRVLFVAIVVFATTPIAGHQLQIRKRVEVLPPNDLSSGHMLLALQRSETDRC